MGPDAITTIHTKKGIVVIDAGISTGLTSKYRDRIEKEFHSTNIAYVINTHAHHDHNRGNSVFKNARIIGHVNSLEEIKKQWEAPEKVKKTMGKVVAAYDLKLKQCQPKSEEWYTAFIQKARYQYAYHDIENAVPVKRPDITFSDSYNLNMGDITFQLKYFGKCHSASDLLIFVPELKLLFTGDLMFRFGKPSVNDSTRADRKLWIASVHWIQQRMQNIETVIGGHGQILSVDDLKSFNRKMLDRAAADE